MPRVSIRSLARVLLGLTTDQPSDTPPLADELQLVEVVGSSRKQVRPAVRPRMGGGSQTFAGIAAVFSVVQLRAGTQPLYVSGFESLSGVSVRWRIGADLIEANRAASADVWEFPASTAIVEGGTTAAAIAGQAVSSPAGAQPLRLGEHYLDPGEVISFHHQTANTALSAAFNWVEVP